MALKQMQRKDIEAMEVILLAIRRVENSAEHGSLDAAIRLDTLYTALKTAATTVVENQKLDELDTSKSKAS